MAIIPMITIERVWQTGDANAEPCKLCEEPIYSETHTLFIAVNEERKIEVGVCVCSSCYEILKDENAL